MADNLWWEVFLPCEMPGGGRWAQTTKWVQAADAAEAIEIAEKLLPRGWELDDAPNARVIPDPYTTDAYRKRLADAVHFRDSLIGDTTHWREWLPEAEKSVAKLERALADHLRDVGATSAGGSTDA